MNTFRFHRSRFPAAALLIILFASLAPAGAGATIRGRVFIDQDRNSVVGPAESGIAGVAVSDGRNVVVTSSTGAYEIEGRASLPGSSRAASPASR